MIIKYNKDTFKILGFYTGNIKDIKLLENEDIKELNVQDCSQVDIRAYNEDGSCKSLEEQIKDGILVLKENEVIKDGIVIELNKSYEEDYIELVKRGLAKLDDDKKIEYDTINKKEYLAEKTLEEKYISGALGDSEYNKQIVSNRMSLYSSQIDPLFMELMQEYFSSIELTKELQAKFDAILEKKKSIKEDLPKTTSDNFKSNLAEKLGIDIENLNNLIAKGVKNGKRKNK